jgi:hypothetical protein
VNYYYSSEGDTMTFRNKNWTKRNYECTNVVACEAEVAPAGNWVPVDQAYVEAILNRGGCQSWLAAGVRYYGWL